MTFKIQNDDNLLINKCIDDINLYVSELEYSSDFTKKENDDLLSYLYEIKTSSYDEESLKIQMLEDKILSIQDRSQKDFQILTNEIIEIKSQISKYEFSILKLFEITELLLSESTRSSLYNSFVSTLNLLKDRLKPCMDIP